jgi:hypothetical protein
MDDNGKQPEAWKPDLEHLWLVQIDPFTPEGADADWEMFRDLFGLSRPEIPGRRRFLGINQARILRARALAQEVEQLPGHHSERRDTAMAPPGDVEQYEKTIDGVTSPNTYALDKQRRATVEVDVQSLQALVAAVRQLQQTVAALVPDEAKSSTDGYRGESGGGE